MEAVSAGSTVLTFIGLALQCTKSLFEIISVYRDAPQQTKSLASALNDLKNTLTQLQSCKNLTNGSVDIHNVTELIQACTKNLQRHEGLLKKFQPDPKTPRVKQMWTRFTATLGEKKLKQIWTEVNHDCTALGFQLQLLHYDKTVAGESQLNQLNDTLTKRNTNDDKHHSLLQEQTSKISVVDKIVTGIEASIADQLQVVKCITRQIEELPDISRQQSENVCKLIQALQSQLAGTSSQYAPPQAQSELAHLDTSLEKTSTLQEERVELAARIQKLVELVADKCGTTYNEEAEPIIDGLGSFIQGVMESCVSTNDEELESRRAVADSSRKDIDNRDMRLIRRITAASHGIDINTKQVLPSPSFGSSPFTSRHKSKEVEIGQYRVSISLTERSSASRDSEDDRAPENRNHSRELIARIKALPARSPSSTVIVARLQQIQMRSGFFAPNPSIIIGRTLPNDSPIFKLVEGGDLKGLQNLLSSGKGNLRDRNLLGAPLLHHASEQPEMCAFLLSQGADIDETAVYAAIGNSRDYRKPLTRGLVFVILDSEMQAPLVECKRLLLRAGADPSLPEGYGEETCAVSEIKYGTSDSIRAMLDIGGQFIDLNARDQSGYTLLLHLCKKWHSDYDVERFKILLTRGANVHVRDMHGRTCLHIAVCTASIDPRDLECLILLINSGADPFAVDDKGLSVSQYANTQHHSGWWSSIGGGRGDLWDAALARCGYDVSEVRKEYPRKPWYSENRYTRKDFEKLWREFEYLCPYYDDPPIWPPGTTFKEVAVLSGFFKS